MMIGIDVGGTSVKSGIVDDNSVIIQKFSQATPFNKDPEIIIDVISKQIDLCLENIKGDTSIGVGIAGVVDDPGTVLFSPNMPKFLNVPLKFILEKKYNCHIVIDNDANAAAVAELVAGSGKNCENFIYVTLGTGIGGAIITGSKIFRGEYGGAGEIGHSIIDYKARPQDFLHSYRAGPLEELCGRSGIISRYEEKSGTKGVDVKDISNLAENGEKAAIETLSETGTMIGLSIATVMNLLDIRTVIIGGGISVSQIIMETIHSTISTRSLPSISSKFDIRRARFGDETGIIGAAYLGKR